ncbi:MAG: dihydroorotate dehydrogenase-like protein [Anaerolineales bacterium]|jgi:dihydroorotate dehydrogenase (fumarate)|uniref:dihydroorotate dehydrogenase-like protein n=1 Tax=Candidatus Villigracilis vicinus TaxID=3140679 RepID=UPI003135CD99|nr:dihydroorotate dehydrogenase-like protein [Anaerolineales bacterium]MBK9782114.1 dihydroorotate dehydrogenase-like protein [Anaerolineales bacterium]
MTELSTSYLGLKLKNPLVASASPLSKKLDTAKKLEEAGISAIVMYSLFEEQIIHESLELDHFLSRGTDSFAEALTYLPDGGMYSVSPEKYLNQLAALKKAVNIPVIGSLNGVSKGGWTSYAKRIEEAGADALELNLYFLSTDPNLTAIDLENAQVELVAEVKSSIKIPLAVKLSPFVTSLPNFAKRIVDAGASGLVLFNRFYQPDFDLEELDIVHSLDLSTSADLRLPLRWISILYGKVNTDYALTSGIHTHTDVLKAMMAGAKVAMMASNLLHNGEKILPEMLNELSWWMESHEYTSIEQMQGSMSQKNVKEPAAFERANYMKVLSSWRDLP